MIFRWGGVNDGFKYNGFTFLFEKLLEVKVIEFLPPRDGTSSTLSKKIFLRSSNIKFDGVGLSWVSLSKRPH